MNSSETCSALNWKVVDDVRCRDGSFGAWYRKAPPVPPSSSSALEPALMLFCKYKVVGVRDIANEI